MTAAEQQAHALLLEALAYFREAVRLEDPICHVISGLDALMRASRLHPHLAVLAPEQAAEARELILDCAFALIGAVAGQVPEDRVMFALGAASSLAVSAPDEFHDDRLLYSALLVSELRQFVCRRELNRRGDPLARAVSMRRAWEAPVPVNAKVQ